MGIFRRVNTTEIALQVEEKLRAALQQSFHDEESGSLSSRSVEFFQDAVHLAEKSNDRSLLFATWQEVADIVKGKFEKDEIPCFQVDKNTVSGGKWSSYTITSFHASKCTISPNSQSPSDNCGCDGHKEVGKGRVSSGK